MGFIDLKINEVDPQALRLLPEKYARAHTLIPFAIKERQLHVAMWNSRDRRVIGEVEQMTGRRAIPHLAPESAIRRAHLLYKGDLRNMLERLVVNETSTVTAERRSGGEDPTAVNLVTRILEYAAMARASDIHIEPYELEAIIRYRIDGALQEVLSLPPTMLPSQVARVKILTNMRIDERRAPQDGRFEADLGGFKNVVNISTIEDPIEYTIPRVNQVQINPAAGIEFATGLRALLRQDPDVIMVGEIRDEETAETAVPSAPVGRLLLSTLHTNEATGAVSRLLDMGVEPFLSDRPTLSSAYLRKLSGERRSRQFEPQSPAGPR